MQTNDKHIAVSQAWVIGLAEKIRRGILQYTLNKPDWIVQCCSTHLPELLSFQADGFILSPGVERIHLAEQFDRPCVLTCYAPDTPLPQVDVDHTAAGTVAADYLTGLGYQRFALWVYNRLPNHERRAEGFLSTMKDKNRKVDTFTCDVLPQYIETKTDELRAWLHELEKPAALFCTSDDMASEVIKICRQDGIQVPDDLAVLGCENDEGLCESIHPAISSVRFSYRKIGFEAARMLDQSMQDSPIPDSPLLLPPEGVEVRMSTSHLAVPDENIRRAIDYIRRHCHEDISMPDVAQHAGMSLRNMQRGFKQYIGHTPIREVQQARIERVKKLLLKTDYSLAEIADQTGYISDHSLGKSFTKITGQSPGSYRRQNLLG